MSSRSVIAGLAIVACAILALVAIAAPPHGPRAAQAPARSATAATAPSTSAAPKSAPAAATPAAPGPRFAYPRELPPGPGKPIAERTCMMCHSAMLITQQAKDSLGWEKTITQMEKWGAPLTLEERDTLRLYLSGQFGPRVKR